ncbi:lysostaphin resistance A-like protein [Candidatus Izemoplasma sp. B36]|uniref:CPBP family intramembrane glutamic endopeptidase n=1 Tax=Candidatus Izemoplasma sp. B36 TaxID=3242468 RepID=UPI003557AFBE
MFKKLYENNISRKILFLLLGVGLYFGVSKLACLIADLFAKGEFGFIWYNYNHIFQALICLLIFFILRKLGVNNDFGINAKNKKETFKIILGFSIFFIGLTTIVFLAIQLFAGWQKYLFFVFDFKHLFSYLFFEGVVVGFGEELLFRALIYTVLFYAFPEKIKIGKNLSVSVAVILAALIFTLAHIDLSTFTFETGQLFMAFGLGIFYGWLLEHTKSIIGPILAHNISDFWLSILYVIFTLLAG